MLHTEHSSSMALLHRAGRGAYPLPIGMLVVPRCCVCIDVLCVLLAGGVLSGAATRWAAKPALEPGVCLFFAGCRKKKKHNSRGRAGIEGIRLSVETDHSHASDPFAILTFIPHLAFAPSLPAFGTHQRPHISHIHSDSTINNTPPHRCNRDDTCGDPMAADAWAAVTQRIFHSRLEWRLIVQRQLARSNPSLVEAVIRWASMVRQQLHELTQCAHVRDGMSLASIPPRVALLIL